jgi:hypothetical protein
VAAVGHDGEAASLIGEEVAIVLVDGHENEMCVWVMGFLRDIFHGIINDVWHMNRLSCWIGKTFQLGGQIKFSIIYIHTWINTMVLRRN